MNIKKKKINLYHVMNIILSVLAIASFLVALVRINQAEQNQNSVNSVGIGSLANYLQFAHGNKSQIIISIALHNLGLAVIAYVLSLLSCGILSSTSIISTFYIAGTVIGSSMNLLTVIFVLLEVLGMSLSVFGGVYIFNKRRKYNMSFRNIVIFSLVLLGILILIYCIAAYIETELIQSLWW